MLLKKVCWALTVACFALFCSEDILVIGLTTGIHWKEIFDEDECDYNESSYLGFK